MNERDKWFDTSIDWCFSGAAATIVLFAGLLFGAAVFGAAIAGLFDK